jgi:hypothetical protein
MDRKKLVRALTIAAGVIFLLLLAAIGIAMVIPAPGS